MKAEESTSIDNNPIVIGCNYHTTWQKHPGMRFVLKDVVGTKARLVTRKSKKDFWTDVKDLIFIQTSYNQHKAEGILSRRPIKKQ